MELDKWIDTYKVRAFPWIDGKTIYFNVQYFLPGQSIARAPKWDRSVLVSDNDNGRKLVYEYTYSLTYHIAGLSREMFNRTELMVVVADAYSENKGDREGIQPSSPTKGGGY